MDKCFDILKNNEIRSFQENEITSKDVFNQFMSTQNRRFAFSHCDTYIEKVLSLKDEYVYNSKYVKDFFDILEKYDYKMQYEILDAIRTLGFLKNPKSNGNTIKRLLTSPVIDDISFDDKNAFSIFSEQYGTFSFIIASEYFKNNHDVLSYIRKNKPDPRSHYHTYFLSKKFPDDYTVTSLVDNYFCGQYYQSYTCDRNSNKIIDLCNNSVMDQDEYNRLVSPQIVSSILNSEVDNELSVVNQKVEFQKINASILKIALYKEYLSSIGYKGSLEDAPSLVKRNIKK